MKVVFVVFILLVNQFSYAQSYFNGKSRKVGYMDNGYPFSLGLAEVIKGGQKAYIDRNGVEYQ